MKPFDYAGKVALITGASSGIGKAFAYELAARGAHLVLVARSTARLQEIADDIHARHGRTVDVIPADLIQTDATDNLVRRLADANLRIDVLINNAGFGTYGQFETLSTAKQCDEIQLNCVALTALTHRLLPDMLQRADAAVINVASTAAFQPVPYMATYAATKAYVLAFSEALWSECQGRGVRVLALCPGATDTAFFDVAAAQEAAVGEKMPVSAVIETAMRALDANHSYVVVGARNRMQSNLHRLLPRETVLKITEKIMRPKAR